MVNPIYDKIGLKYDVTRRADPEITATLKNLLGLETGHNILDIGCGSGNYTVALEQFDVEMVGVDISEAMLSQARKKSQTISWVQADAFNLPFESNEFDGAICTLALHHVGHTENVFCELYRVLKPNKHFVIFTSTPKQMQQYWLCHYFPNMMQESCRSMLSEDELISALYSSGFSQTRIAKYFVSNQLQDWFLLSGKYRPEIYCETSVREGISSFAKTEHLNEVQTGIDNLKLDIKSGKINSIIEKYESDLGDYLFVVATA